ncbi:hypothetical protein DFH27DRAFT_365391 [Peziza echinospora]|nr:hypothetical protein DFH27DRAFT_365391 [Peziza echinospora]
MSTNMSDQVEKPKLKRGAVEPIPHITDNNSGNKKQKQDDDATSASIKTSNRIHNRGVEAQQSQISRRVIKMVTTTMNKKFLNIRVHMIPNFDFKSHLSSLKHVKDSIPQHSAYAEEWSKRTDLLVLNEDMVVKAGDDALVCLLKGLNIDRNKKLSDKIVDFANIYRPKDSNFKEVRYRSGPTPLPPTQRTGNITYFLHTGTIGLGNENRTPSASATMVGSVKAVNANVQLLWDLEFTSLLNNAALNNSH